MAGFFVVNLWRMSKTYTYPQSVLFLMVRETFCGNCPIYQNLSKFILISY